MDLFRFLDLVLVLPADLLPEHEEALRKEVSSTMEWISNFERRAIDRGLQQGLQQGAVQTAREGILDTLKLRFTRTPRSVSARLRKLDDPATLRSLHRKAVTAESLEEFEQALLETAGGV